jgi:hypothetical protein
MEITTLRTKLSHVLWIGGGTDAGKTTVAEKIVERHNFAYYSFDRHERSHTDRIAATGYYTTGRKNPFDMTPDELWVDREPADMAVNVITSWSRRAEFAIEDILAMPSDTTIIAEGPGFFPEIIAPLLTNQHQAIWLVPTVQFKRKIAIQRGKPSVRFQTRDPIRATENIIGRDLRVAEHVKKEAQRHQAKWVEVDGSQSVDEMIKIVEQHFTQYLRFK